MHVKKYLLLLNKISLRLFVWLFTTLLLTVLLFQNCAPSKMTSSSFGQQMAQESTLPSAPLASNAEYSIFFESGPTTRSKDPEFLVKFRIEPELSPGHVVQCSFNDDTFKICTSQISGRSVQDGVQSLAVQVFHLESKVGTAKVYQWNLDQAAPEIVVHLRPNPTSAVAREEIRFTAVDEFDANPTIECQIDGLEWSACSSPLFVDSIQSGPRRLVLRVTDILGHSRTEEITWTYSKIKPTIVLNQKPEAYSNNRSPFFSYSLSDVSQTEFSRFECRAKSDQSFVTCNGGISFQTLTDGAYQFEVRAKNDAGEMTEATAYNFFIDTKAPRVQMVIANNSPGPTQASTLKFTVNSSDEGGSSASGVGLIECTYGSLPLGPCRDDLDYTFLSSGEYEFKFVAVDRAGNRSEIYKSIFWFFKVKPTAKFKVESMSVPGIPSEKLVISVDVSGDNFRPIYLKLRDDTMSFASPATSKIGSAFNRWDWDYHLPSPTVTVPSFAKNVTFEIFLSQDLRSSTARQITLAMTSDYSYDFNGLQLVVNLDGYVAPPLPPGVPTFANLMNQNGVLGKYCLKCHNSVDRAGALDITDYNSLISDTVTAGEPLNSYLFTRMNSTTGNLARPMPLDGFLSPIEVDVVRKWIENGALNN